ncbi:energy transducer TonB [Terracidiphilus gabretensis]|uniref:energy transducer TonB n=1 Tax=Terracidiphilus gabretensis TaxID=1577687 RepID=UPI00071BB495|nr:energy transducer TonB [Terracidiphilus gabretensis]
MQFRLFVFAASFIATMTFIAGAQDFLTVDESAIRHHAQQQASPVYPPIAKAAQVQGTVVLSVKIDASGRVESVQAQSGPPMLRQAAIDAFRQWTFQPFEKDGKAVKATGSISIAFDLGKDGSTPDELKTAKEYFAVDGECRKAVSNHSDVTNAASVCDHAAKIAEQFPSDRRFIEKRSAYVWAAWATIYNNDFSAGLNWAKKAVMVVQLKHDDNSGSNAAYTVLALAEAKSGDLQSADSSFSTAEDFGRKAIAWAKQVGFEHGDSYRQSLNQDLHLHAQVLQVLNRPQDAQKKLDEAATLQ